MIGLGVAALAGGIVGWQIGRSGKPVPVDYSQLIRQITDEKPVTYNAITLDASTARSQEEIKVSATFLEVKTYPSSVHFYASFNEPNNDLVDLSELRYITGPIYRLFVTNSQGNGQIEIKSGRGMTFESQAETLAELACRINFDVPSAYDRRGEVIFADSFEHGLQAWETTPSGVGSSITIDNTVAKNKEQSCKIITGDALGNESYLTTSRRLPTLGRIGYEMSFTGPNTGGKFKFYLFYLTGAQQKICQVDYIANSDKIYIYSGPAGALVELSLDYPLHINSRGFHIMKMVGDFNTGYWKKLMIDHLVFDISQYPMWIVANASRPILTARCGLWPSAVGNKTQHIDDFILTQNEP